MKRKRTRTGSARTHALGQNFLIDVDVAMNIIAAAAITPDENILEVGPGQGMLTSFLAESGANILAVEKDAKLVQELIPQFAQYKNVRIVYGDIQTFDYKAYFQNKTFSVVANLPYSVGTNVIRSFLEAAHKPERMIVMLQKEVAARMVAKPPHMSVLSHVVQIFAQAKILFPVHKESFKPVPKVESAVISFETYKKPLVDQNEYQAVIRCMKAGFANKRKTLENALSGSLQMEKEVARKYIESLGFPHTLRAEALSLEDWIKLSRILSHAQHSTK